MMNLTFLIPIRIESEDRLKNVNFIQMDIVKKGNRVNWRI